MKPVPNFIILAMRQLCGIADRHRPGYWREYHEKNATARRPYLTAKMREYRTVRKVVA